MKKFKGILQTALIVGVLSETLIIPPDEKRILASVDRQSEFLSSTKHIFSKMTNFVKNIFAHKNISEANQIRRHAAAKLIQCTWHK